MCRATVAFLLVVVVAKTEGKTKKVVDVSQDLKGSQSSSSYSRYTTPVASYAHTSFTPSTRYGKGNYETSKTYDKKDYPPIYSTKHRGKDGTQSDSDVYVYGYGHQRNVYSSSGEVKHGGYIHKPTYRDEYGVTSYNPIGYDHKYTGHANHALYTPQHGVQSHALHPQRYGYGRGGVSLNAIYGLPDYDYEHAYGHTYGAATGYYEGYPTNGYLPYQQRPYATGTGVGHPVHLNSSPNYGYGSPYQNAYPVYPLPHHILYRAPYRHDAVYSGSPHAGTRGNYYGGIN